MMLPRDLSASVSALPWCRWPWRNSPLPSLRDFLVTQALARPLQDIAKPSPARDQMAKAMQDLERHIERLLPSLTPARRTAFAHDILSDVELWRHEIAPALGAAAGRAESARALDRLRRAARAFAAATRDVPAEAWGKIDLVAAGRACMTGDNSGNGSEVELQGAATIARTADGILNAAGDQLRPIDDQAAARMLTQLLAESYATATGTRPSWKDDGVFRQLVDVVIETQALSVRALGEKARRSVIEAGALICFPSPPRGRKPRHI